MPNPLISVIIPVFNREKYVAEAIESVLSQDYRPIELFVVDDGSSDRSADIIKSFLPDLHYVYQENKGTSGARNKGVSLAKGSYLAFLDSDDIWMPGKLVKQLDAFELNSDLDVVFGRVEQFFSPEVDEEFRARFRLINEPIPAYLSSAMLICRSAFDRVGGYDERIQNGTDMEWYSRLIDLDMKVMALQEIVYRRRIHYSNLNNDVQKATSIRLHELKSIIDRRRQKT